MSRRATCSARGLAPLEEDADVGVAEAVDRLELVAHVELLRVGRRHQVDEVALEAVRVLELVHQDVPEALAHGGAHRLVVPEQVAGAQLEVGEVERSLGVLGRGVGLVEAGQEVDESTVLPGGDGLEGVAGQGGAGRLVLLRAGWRMPQANGLEVDELDRVAARLAQVLQPRGALEVLGRPAALDAFQEADDRLGLGLRRRQRAGEVGRLGARRGKPAAGGPQALVGRGEHAAQAIAAVGHEQVQGLVWLLLHGALEGLVEGLGGHDAGTRLVEHAERRVDAGGEGVLPQEAGTEAVDGRDLRPLRQAGELVAGRTQAGAHARHELVGGPLGEGDDEQPLGVEAALDGQGHPLHEHRRLACPRARGDEHHAAALDGPALVGGQRGAHPRATRQIGQASHQEGHEPCRGSCRMSPRRILRTEPRASSRARSMAPQNASSSR